MYKQCMSLVGWIHWVYKKVNILDVQNVLLMETCKPWLKVHWLGFQIADLIDYKYSLGWLCRTIIGYLDIGKQDVYTCPSWKKLSYEMSF